MKKRLLHIAAIFIIVLVPAFLSAQQEAPVTFGELLPKDFNLPSSTIVDSNTHAVIIADVGATEFKGNDRGYLSYVYTRKRRIKIMHQSALDDLTSVYIQLRSGLRNSTINDVLSELECFTYNLENGNVVSTRLPLNEVFENRLSPRLIEKKFTMPAAKVGSIIEYSYKVSSYYYNRMPGWDFQHQLYPCLWSEYKIVLPAILGYSTIRRGTHSFFIDKSQEDWAKYSVKFPSNDAYASQMSVSVATTTVKRRWVMKDVPAFNGEEYVVAPSNYLDGIDFQLVKVYNNADNGTKMQNYTWDKLADELLDDHDFGIAVLPSENGWMEKLINKLVSGETDQYKKANMIYNYVVENIKCTDHEDIFTSGLYELGTKRTGSVGDINLLLTAMLKMARIKADPVVLSTRDQGYTDPHFPILDNLNYVICRCQINGTMYNLDASRPFLGFGNIPLECYNGYAKVISRTDTSGIFLAADSVREKRITVITLANDDKNKGGMSGDFQLVPGSNEAYRLRTNIIRDGENEYFKNVKSSYGSEFDINKITIDSLRNRNEPLKINMEIKISHDQSDNIFYFTPGVFNNTFKSNPLGGAKRNYPVEMGYPMDEMFVLNMEVPEGYEVDEMPQSTKVSYNQDEGYFNYQIAKNDNNIQLRITVKLFRATFQPSEYNDLREFFSFIVKKQNEQIVFKRKKG